MCEVAAQRLRISYTQLVDTAEGFVPATEIIGAPFLVDPPPSPGVVVTKPPEKGEGKGEVESGTPITSKAKPPTRGGSLTAENKEPPEEKDSFPIAGEEKEESPDSKPILFQGGGEEREGFKGSKGEKTLPKLKVQQERRRQKQEEK